MTVAIIDTDVALTASRLAELKNLGVVAVGRYLNRSNPNGAKVIKPAEARLFAAHNMRLFLIYEFNGKPVSPAAATLDGEWSVEYSKTIGAPQDGSAFIARTMDYDAPESDMPAIKADGGAFARSIAPAFQTWAYASGAVNGELWTIKAITGRWLTCSNGYRGTRAALAAGAYEMRQALPHETGGIDADPDTCHVAGFVPGFIPFAPRAPAPAPTSAAPASESLLGRFEDYWRGKQS